MIYYMYILTVIRLNTSFTVLLYCNMLFTSPVSAVEEGEAIIRDAMEQAENPHHLGVTGTAGTRPYQACSADVTVRALCSSKSLLSSVSLCCV